jgi:hypothetical protein
VTDFVWGLLAGAALLLVLLVGARGLVAWDYTHQRRRHPVVPASRVPTPVRPARVRRPVVILLVKPATRRAGEPAA